MIGPVILIDGKRDVPGAGIRGEAIGAAMLVLAAAGSALAADRHPISGEYVCTAFCRPSDAPPGIQVEGSIVKCMSELGGIYTGTLLSDTSVSCFNQIGTLSADGTTIHWSNGAVWQRRPSP